MWLWLMTSDVISMDMLLVSPTLQHLQCVPETQEMGYRRWGAEM